MALWMGWMILRCFVTCFFQNEQFGWSWTLPPYDTLSKNTHIDCLGLGLKLLQMLQQIQLDTWYNMMQPSSSVIIRLFNTVHVAPATPPTLEPHRRRGPDSGREKRWNLAKTHRVKPALQELAALEMYQQYPVKNSNWTCHSIRIHRLVAAVQGTSSRLQASREIQSWRALPGTATQRRQRSEGFAHITHSTPPWWASSAHGHLRNLAFTCIYDVTIRNSNMT